MNGWMDHQLSSTNQQQRRWFSVSLWRNVHQNWVETVMLVIGWLKGPWRNISSFSSARPQSLFKNRDRAPINISSVHRGSPFIVAAQLLLSSSWRPEICHPKSVHEKGAEYIHMQCMLPFFNRPIDLTYRYASFSSTTARYSFVSQNTLFD